MTGPEASKEFYKLRQRFGKEKKKVRGGKPRSGAGAGSAYLPNWILYKDLEFLTEHIQARERTSTNHISSCGKAAAQFVPKMGRGRSTLPGAPWNGSSDVADFPGVDRPSVPGPSRFDIDSTRSSPLTYRSDDPLSISGPSICNDGPTRSSTPISSTSTPDDVLTVCASVDSDSIGTMDFSTIEVPNDSSSNTSRPMKVPEPDSSFKRRRRESDAINQSVLENSRGINKLAATVGAALERAMSSELRRSSSMPAIFDTLSPNTQVMVTSVALALSKISEEDQLSCLIDMLNIVKTKYTKKQ